MHLHLNPLGGLAGDMFCAALLDAEPGLLEETQATVAGLGMSVPVRIELQAAAGTLSGRRFRVQPLSGQHHGPHHSHYRDIVSLLELAPLTPPVRARALNIFEILARAEARVHGIEPDAVHFHEVGNWDAIADIVSAAFLLDALEVHSASTDPLPLGGGRVHTAHGILPVPAPATRLLLQGLPVNDDGVPGERVTPTGAAILQSLSPSPRPLAGTLSGSGMGFGTRDLDGIPNCLQVLCIDTVTQHEEFRPAHDQVAILRFEVDDQNPEDFAQAMDHLRATPGVLSVICLQGIGKQGRPTMSVELLARPEAMQDAIVACFQETTTIGLRRQYVDRCVLNREQHQIEIQERVLEIKQVQRPTGRSTKLESRDLRHVSGHAERERLRSLAVNTAGSAGDGCND